MGKAIPTVEGWHSQHMVFAMDFSAWNCFTADEKAAARNELKAFLADLEATLKLKKVAMHSMIVMVQKGI